MLAIYGFGEIGLKAATALINGGNKIEFILDNRHFGKIFENVNIFSLETIPSELNRDIEIYITMNNHYVDINNIKKMLENAGFKKIFSLIELQARYPELNFGSSYWFDRDVFSSLYIKRCQNFFKKLNDKKSVDVVEAIFKYRRYGRLDDYPQIDFGTEYIPVDLPRYKNPIRLIDCGAYNGIGIEQLIHAGYELDSVVAFEPDTENYLRLVEKNYGEFEKIFLPLAAWSKEDKLQFSNNGSMSSKLGDQGLTIVQSATIDRVLPNYKPTLIKMDIEGAEFEALLGAKKTILECQPDLCISIYHSPADLYRIGELINSWNVNYKFYVRLHEHNTFGVVLYCRRT